MLLKKHTNCYVLRLGEFPRPAQALTLSPLTDEGKEGDDSGKAKEK